MTTTYRTTIRRTMSAIAASVAVTFAVALLPTQGATAATTKNIVVNGDFADGKANWRTNRPADHKLTAAAVGRNGSMAAVITPSDRVTAVLNEATRDTVTSAVAGTKYTMTAWVRASRAGTVSQIKAREVTNNGTIVNQTRLRLKDTAWHQLTVNFTVKKTGSSLDLNVLFWNNKPGQRLYVDSVSLTQTSPAVTQPKPSVAPVAPGGSGGSTESCKRPSPAGTVFGSSISTSDVSAEQALRNTDAQFGKIPVVRVFDPDMVMEWDKPRTDALAGRDLVISFRPSPQSVLTGKYDAELRRWFQQAPSDAKIYWSYIHEPEPMIDRGEFTADQYRRAWQRINGIADSVCRTNMYATLILTGWTTKPESKRSYKTYYPGSDVIDVMAFDPYNGSANPGRDNEYASPESIFDSVRAVAADAGKPYGVAETGSLLAKGDPGTDRANWLRAMGAYHDRHKAVFVTYFNSTNGGEYRLLDTHSKGAWRAVVGSSD